MADKERALIDAYSRAPNTGHQSIWTCPLQPDATGTRDLRIRGLGHKAVIESDLVEWNYGEYEGLTSEQIQEMALGWLIFRDGCPGGETPEQVGARKDRVIARSRAVDGDIALSAARPARVRSEGG